LKPLLTGEAQREAGGAEESAKKKESGTQISGKTVVDHMTRRNGGSLAAVRRRRFGVDRARKRNARQLLNALLNGRRRAAKVLCTSE
jgi:hypothetical protein